MSKTATHPLRPSVKVRIAYSHTAKSNLSAAIAVRKKVLVMITTLLTPCGSHG